MYYQVLWKLPSYSWWKKSCTSCFYEVLYIPGGCLGFLNHQQYFNAHPKLVPAFIAPLAVVVPALATVGVITPFITIGLGPTLYHLSNWREQREKSIDFGSHIVRPSLKFTRICQVNKSLNLCMTWRFIVYRDWNATVGSNPTYIWSSFLFFFLANSGSFGESKFFWTPVTFHHPPEGTLE